MGTLYTLSCITCGLEQHVAAGRGMSGTSARPPYGCNTCQAVAYAAKPGLRRADSEPRCETCSNPLYPLALDDEHEDDAGPCPRAGCGGQLRRDFAGLWD